MSLPCEHILTSRSLFDWYPVAGNRTDKERIEGKEE
jgi:hypothetical protein